MVGHGESSAGSYLADPTSPIPSHCVYIVATSTLRVKNIISLFFLLYYCDYSCGAACSIILLVELTWQRPER